MNTFFSNFAMPWEDGSFKMTFGGILVLIAIILALVVLAAFLKMPHAEKKPAMTAKQLAYSGMALAIAMVCSMIKFSELPMGGSITLFSMLFVVLIGYWYGPYVGIMTAVAYGLIQFVTEPIFYTIPQMVLDYPLAFGALGLAGFFYRRKHGLLIGYLVGVLGRYVFAVISGVVFFAAYAPEGMHPLVYSISYQATYLLPEAVATILILSIPQVSTALGVVKKNALST